MIFFYFTDIGETDDSSGGGGGGGGGGSGGGRRRSLSGPDPQDLVRYHSLPGAKGVYRRLIKYLLHPVYTVDQVFSSKNQGAPTANKLANLVQVINNNKYFSSCFFFVESPLVFVSTTTKKEKIRKEKKIYFFFFFFFSFESLLFLFVSLFDTYLKFCFLIVIFFF